MTFQDYYKEIGDYEDVLTRLMNEKLIRKYVCKFLDDSSYRDLVQALSQNNYPDAFRFAHTLKGVSRNLGLTKVFELSNEITEILRDEQPHDVSNKMAELTKEYEHVVHVIEQIKAEELKKPPLLQ